MVEACIQSGTVQKIKRLEILSNVVATNIAK